jgi:WD40 repeat protein
VFQCLSFSFLKTPFSKNYGSVDIPVLSLQSVLLWDIVLPGTRAITSLAWSDTALLQLCCGCSDGSVSVWNLLDHCAPVATSVPIASTSSSIASRGGAATSGTIAHSAAAAAAVAAAAGSNSHSSQAASNTTHQEFNRPPPMSTSNSTLSAAPKPLLTLMDFQQLDGTITSISAVRAVQFCPYEPHLILAVGQGDAQVILYDCTPLLRAFFLFRL